MANKGRHGKGSGMKGIAGMFSVWLVLVLSAHAVSFDCAKARRENKSVPFFGPLF